MRALVRLAVHALAVSRFVVAGVVLLACEGPASVDLPAGPRADGGDAGGDVRGPEIDAAATECVMPRDCASGVCTAGRCARSSATDRVQNGDETDVDCGGIAGPRCGDGLSCLTRRDCQSGVCAEIDRELRCAPARPDDGVRNADESSIDCGGRRARPCAAGDACALPQDCESRVCHEGTCQAPRHDLVKNGRETDVDCGGPFAPPCALGAQCLVHEDCQSSSCARQGSGWRCAAPSPFDGRKNGTETDVDCGGAGNPRCRAAMVCQRDADCASLGCAYDGRCAERRSCVSHFGGDTCGTGELADGTRAHESCCASVAVRGSRGPARLGKYGVTAGRVRVFLDAVAGDVRGFVRRARRDGAFGPDAVLLPEWELYLPTSFEGDAAPGELADPPQGSTAPMAGIYTSAYRHVSGFIFRDNEQTLTGCTNAGPGTHTVYVPDEAEGRLLGDVPHQVSRSLLDTKGANCVNYLFAQAFCAWDGGRLQHLDEYEDAWGPTIYPWGDLPHPIGPGSGTYFANRFPTATDASLRAQNSPFAPSRIQSTMLAAFSFSYEHPALVGADYGVFIPAPGRMLGRGPRGHSLTDGLMELTGTFFEASSSDPFRSKVAWARNGSFEGHGVGALFVAHVLNKYGKVGLRCAYPVP